LRQSTPLYSANSLHCNIRPHRIRRPAGISFYCGAGVISCIVSRDDMVTMVAWTGSPAGPEPRCKPCRPQQPDRISKHIPARLVSMYCAWFGLVDKSILPHHVCALHCYRIAHHDPSTAGILKACKPATSRRKDSRDEPD
jgi:hypothetical protein